MTARLRPAPVDWLARCWALVLLVLIAPALTGCFVSDQPLIRPADAAFPFEKIVATSSMTGERTTFQRQGDVYRATSDTEPEGLEFLFMKLADNLFLAQARDTTHNPPFIYYGYVRVDPEANIARVYKISATDGDQGSGIERCHDDRDVCIGSLDAYRTFVEQAIAQGDQPALEFKIEQRE